MFRALYPKVKYPQGHPDLAASLYILGGMLNAQGEYAKAEPFYRDALAMFRTLYPKEKYPQGHLVLALTLNNLGALLQAQGEYARAEPFFREALAMFRALYPKEKYPQGNPHLALSLNNLGGLLQAQGEYARAELFYREALAMYRSLYPKAKYPHGHPDLAISLNNLGSLFKDQGEYAKAELFLRDALKMRRALYPQARYPQGHPDLALSLNNLGLLLQAQGEYASAEPFSRESLAMCRTLYPKAKYPQGHPYLAANMNNLGFLLQAQGEYARAEPFYRDALAMYRALFSKAKYPHGHPQLALSLNNLGLLLKDQGEYARAEPFYRDALAMYRALYPKEKYPQGHPHLASSLHNLGHLLWTQGEYARAEPFYRDALAMYRALYSKAKYPHGHPDLALSLNNLGAFLLAQGEYARAEPFYRDALAMYRALYSKAKYPHGHPDLALSLNNLGFLLKEQGEYARAEPFFREAWAMYRSLYSKAKYPHGHPELVTSLSNLGALLLAQRDYARAEPFFRNVLAMSRGQLQRLAEVSAEAVALNFAASFPLDHDAYLSVTRYLPPPAGVYEEMWQRKALLSRVLERRHLDLLASKDPQAHQLAGELTLVRQRLAHLLLRPATDATEHARLLDQLTEEKEDREQRLARLLRLKTALVTETSPQTLAQALPGDTVFLDLIRYTDFDHDSTRPGIKGERRTPRYVAFLVRPVPKKAERIELGPAQPIEEAWEAWRQAIVNNRPDREAAARFARLTWEPLRKHLPASVRTVYLSADDALTQVPWAALPGSKPGSVLLEEHAFAYVPHGPWLLAQLKRPEKPPATAGRLLVAGGIAYDRATADIEKPSTEEVVLRAPPLVGKGVVWKDLPGTAREHEQILALARKLFRQPPLSRSGAAASTAQLQEDLPRVRYAHLATHGFFADPQFRSAFQVDETQFERLRLERHTAGARSPLTLSGLVLAGANRQGKDAAPDRGILTAEALVGLRLDDMELAVLSACDTGRGDFRVAGGEGVYGLQRAFHLAGCKNVIASLWRVDDDATAALMGVFYRKLWQDRMPPLEALRQAQLYLYHNPSAIPALAKRRGDLFAEVDLPKETIQPDKAAKHALISQWAAFVLSGSGR